MSKKQIKKIIFMGVGCALLLIVGTIYSLLYNDGRWVKNMDMSEYVFSYKDIPMLVIGALIALYAIYIVIICFKNVFSKNSREKRYSRTISPYWGFCGMFGFLGFGGFWTYYKFGEIFPFAFFIFFGFFSFFFEGKLSHILEDELFQENKRKAQLEAYKIGFKLLFVVIWLMAIGMFSRNVEWCAMFMLISVSTIQKVLDIDIDYYTLINMQGMIDLVDAVGGIEVTNHFDFPISIAENEPEFQAKVEPGTHKINGEQALVYSRMRYDDPDGDYGRQKRQREVIQKVVAKLLKMDSIGSYKKILSAVSSNVQTSIDLGDTNTLRSLMGYSDALKNIKSYQLAGSDAMINGGSYQVASTEDILKVQNRIKQEVGKKKVSESNLKTSLVLYGSGSSNYGSDDFVNSKGSAASSEASSNYEGGTSEAAGGGSVSTYNGGTTYSNNYSENTGNYVQEQGTTTPTYNNNGSGVTTYSTVPATQ